MITLDTELRGIEPSASYAATLLSEEKKRRKAAEKVKKIA